MGRDLYFQLGNELRALFQDLHPADSEKVHRHMKKVLAAASKIGGQIFNEAKQLDADLANYLKNPENSSFASIMRKHALRLEQETREL